MGIRSSPSSASAAIDRQIWWKRRASAGGARRTGGPKSTLFAAFVVRGRPGSTNFRFIGTRSNSDNSKSNDRILMIWLLLSRAGGGVQDISGCALAGLQLWAGVALRPDLVAGILDRSGAHPAPD